MNNPPNVIAFSYAKNVLLGGTRERERMVKYGSLLGTYHVIVFTKKAEQRPARVEEKGVYFYATNSTSKFNMVKDAYKIGRSIINQNKEKKWTVSAQDPFGSSLPPLGLSLFCGAALQVQIHGDVFNKSFFSRNVLAIGKRCYAIFVLHRAKKIRVVSERIKRSLLVGGVRSEKIIVLPIQSDIQTFFKVGEGRAYALAGGVKFLYVGRFAPEKNLLLLIRSFAQAKSEGMNGALLLLGEGPTKTALVAEAQRLNVTESVSFLPWSNDVAAIMGTVDVLCLSSFHEGYAMVLHEAMAAGLPVITTDVGCAKDVLRDKKEGLVVSVGDTRQYVEALKTLAHDSALRQQYGISAHARAQACTLSDEKYLHELVESFTV